jgi:ABC-type Zn2+ transport system substrate-binding protein/surface adhesin
MNKSLLLKSLLWDYNISTDEIEQLINGEIDHVYHYTFESFMQKMIQNLPWYTIIRIVPLKRIKEVLTQSFIDKIRQPSLRNKYNYVRNKLQTIVFPSNEGVTII